MNLELGTIVGGVTYPEWKYDNGYVMHRVPEAPYIYRAENVGFDGRDPFFKISAAIKDNWDQKFWFFRDAEDASKMVLNQSGDIKWQVDGTGNYTVEANTATNEITITKLPLTDKLYVVGDACLTGWETDMAPALIRTDDAAQVYSAVLYLAADQRFKFLSQPMWDHAEYAYIHIDDLASAHFFALQSLLESQTSEIYNVGYAQGFSVKEVIDCVKKVSGIFVGRRY